MPLNRGRQNTVPPRPVLMHRRQQRGMVHHLRRELTSLFQAGMQRAYNTLLPAAGRSPQQYAAVRSLSIQQSRPHTRV